MNKGRTARAGAVLAGAALALVGAATGTAAAHGTMGEPVSRIAACYAEGPENPQSEVCKRLVEENGAQALYDWNEVNIPDADGRHREIIPDGELCSAGREKYSGLDDPGAWETTALPSGGEYTFSYTASAPHKGYFELYVTKDGWSQDQELTWDALEDEPFLRVDQPEVVDGAYQLTGRLPEGKSGQHLIYAVWQRTDSPEAFYSCSDVEFGGEGTGTSSSEGAGEPFAPEEHGDHGEHGGHADGTAGGTGSGEEAQLASGADSGGTSGTGDADPTPADEAAPPASGESGGSSEEDGPGQTAADGSSESLPVTGSALTGLFLAAAGAIAVGATAIAIGRKRRSAGAHRS
ncbi:lytic polysaccharide monooxygenase auxiliary activity family 9 protein [Nocardiopsis suaedae]|uniref:Lytic polysaccharide monooxygenase n=1 Tax=Nocardiopsis suaedae TaxID=3018444 RepID=A0ABT4TEN2_9ACTN|nr:lytic polysaccharide monooxygenase [Nocardiopsis suaedae]MDA2803163.1 lytic polysaccharide monooxygenase [Nocardiopsis suaedae]